MVATNTSSKAFTATTCEVECSAEDARMIEAAAKVQALGTVDLTSYDIIIMNTSAGKDSQAAMDVLVQLATEQGVLDRITALHCDLGRCEWQGVRDLAVRQAEAYGLPCVVVSRPGNDLLDQVQHERKAWPAIGLAQYCTSDHKTSQAAKVITQLTKDIRVAEGHSPLSPARKVRVLQVLGIRAQESGRRGQREPFANRADNRLKTEDEWFPIFDYTTEQVWERISASGVEHHEAYDKGMSRLSCCFCVVARLADLRIAGQHNRQLLAQYVQVERNVDAHHRVQQAVAQWDAHMAGEKAKPITGHTFKQGWALEALWQELYPGQDVDAAAADEAAPPTEPTEAATPAQATPTQPQPTAPQADTAQRVAAALYSTAKARSRRITAKGVRINRNVLGKARAALGGSLAGLPSNDVHRNANSVIIGGTALELLASALNA